MVVTFSMSQQKETKVEREYRKAIQPLVFVDFIFSGPLNPSKKPVSPFLPNKALIPLIYSRSS